MYEDMTCEAVLSGGVKSHPERRAAVASVNRNVLNALNVCARGTSQRMVGSRNVDASGQDGRTPSQFLTAEKFA
jgi:hypothetical protein